MTVDELRKAIKGLRGDAEILIVYGTVTSVFKPCYQIKVIDNGERKFLQLSAIDPNESAAERSMREFMCRR